MYSDSLSTGNETIKEVDNNSERLTALREELARSELRAPVDGTVVDLKVFTIAGELVTVSADRLIAYYLGRVQGTPEGMQALIRSQHTIHPGMPAGKLRSRIALVNG
jgi:hypothetical protein